MKKQIIQSITVAIAAITLFAASSVGAQQEKGAERLFSKPLRTGADIAAVKSGDQVAMACPKCKTVAVTRVAEGRNPAKATEKIGKHECPACKSSIEVSKTGKASTEQVAHKCSHCGSADAFCTVLEKKEKK